MNARSLKDVLLNLMIRMKPLHKRPTRQRLSLSRAVVTFEVDFHFYLISFHAPNEWLPRSAVYSFRTLT